MRERFGCFGLREDVFCEPIPCPVDLDRIWVDEAPDDQVHLPRDPEGRPLPCWVLQSEMGPLFRLESGLWIDAHHCPVAADLLDLMLGQLLGVGLLVEQDPRGFEERVQGMGPEPRAVLRGILLRLERALVRPGMLAVDPRHGLRDRYRSASQDMAQRIAQALVALGPPTSLTPPPLEPPAGPGRPAHALRWSRILGQSHQWCFDVDEWPVWNQPIDALVLPADPECLPLPEGVTGLALRLLDRPEDPVVVRPLSGPVGPPRAWDPVMADQRLVELVPFSDPGEAAPGAREWTEGPKLGGHPSSPGWEGFELLLQWDGRLGLEDRRVVLWWRPGTLEFRSRLIA